MNPLKSYFHCLSEAGLLYPFFAALVIVMVLFILYVRKRNFGFLIAGQSVLTLTITVSLLTMECALFHLIWVYAGIILIGVLLFYITKYYMMLGRTNIVLKRFSSIGGLEREFGIPIRLEDSQRPRAYVFRNEVIVTIGLLEILDRNEIRAVVAHEVYHLRRSPSSFLTSVFALTSLTFLRYRDEHRADRYAARVVGKRSISSALLKLDIMGAGKRIRMLSD